MPEPGAVQPTTIPWVRTRKVTIGNTELTAHPEDINALAHLTASMDELNRLEESAAGDIGIGVARIAKATYDFAVHGGAIGTVNLGVQLPANAIVLDGMVDVLTAPTSADAATIAVQVEAANDIINAAAITGAPWSTTGRKDIIPVGTAATSKKTTVTRAISVVIGAHALTGGRFSVFLRYVVSD